MTQRLIKFAIAIACGGLLGLSSAALDLWPLAWLAWSPILWIVLDERIKWRWVYGYICGLVGNAAAFYWLPSYFRHRAQLPFGAAMLLFGGLISYQAIGWGLFSYGLRRFHQRSVIPVVVIAPILFVAIEFVIPNPFVPFLAITQAGMTPVIQIAELTGPLGVSFMIMLGNAALYETVRALYFGARFPVGRVVASAGVLATAIAFGFVRIHQVRQVRSTAPTFTVGVVQANIGAHQSAQLEEAQHLLFLHQKLSADLEHAGADLIVWPQTSYPYVFVRDQEQDRLLGDPRRVRSGFLKPLLFGALTVEHHGGRPSNSALLLDESGNVRGHFDSDPPPGLAEGGPTIKRLRFIESWLPAVNLFARDSAVEILLFESPVGTIRVAPIIGSEDLSSSVGRRLATLHPNLLVNLDDDGGFGETSEPRQRLGLSVFRAVEMRLDLVRALSTGVSAFIDSTGRVYAKTRAVSAGEPSNNSPDTLLAKVAVQQAQTLYASMANWFGLGCVIASLLSGVIRRTKSVEKLRRVTPEMGGTSRTSS